MDRYAVTFMVRPGSEATVRRILSEYPRPTTVIDEATRLLGTTVFLWQNRVVRVMEVEGRLDLVMRHLSSEPAIRATEQALNPYLTVARDLRDPNAAREFFARAMMRRVANRVTAPELLPPDADRLPRLRVALCYPVRAGCGEQVEALLSGNQQLQVRAAEQTALANTTVFRHGDFVFRLAEFVGDLDTAAEHLGRAVGRAPTTEALNALLDEGTDLTTEAGFGRFFDSQRLSLVTDRRQPRERAS